MRTILFYLLVVSTGCSHQSSTSGDNKPLPLPPVKVFPITTVPAGVQEYIATYLPGWTIPGVADYATSFWSFYDHTIVPYFTAVDINDDQLVDYGVLVKKQGAVQLAILLGANNSFTHVIVNDLRKAFPDAAEGLQHCLLPEPPGQTDVAHPTIKSLILRSNGINLLHLENRVCIYYWDGRAIAAFETM